MGDPSKIRETKISINANEKTWDALRKLLREFKYVFSWPYENMLGLSVDLVV